MNQPTKLRLRIVGFVVLSLFAALVARLWYLQVVGGEGYEAQAHEQNTREIAIEAPRGEIVDARGRVIVGNRTAAVVTIDRRGFNALSQPEALLERLATELTAFGYPTTVADLAASFDDPQFDPVEPVPVASDVNKDLELFLLERSDEFPSVDVARESVRHYPYGSLAAHVLGYVGRITGQEFEAKMVDYEGPGDHPKPYESDDHIGKTGVEQVYEWVLRGVPGRKVVEVDAHGQVVRSLDYQPPVPGNTLQLTIDIDAQAQTERSLREGLDAARSTVVDGPDRRAPAGSAVVMDSRFGTVVAMASYPTYDPTEFVGGISQERYDELLGGGAAEDPFTNRAIAGQYAPGSTFKLVTAFAGLSQGLIAPQSTLVDGGSYSPAGCAGAGCSFQNAGGVAYGPVSVERALTVSSDVFFYWLGDRFWTEREVYGSTGLQDVAESFGLGRPTGIELPFEAAGRVPTPERRVARHNENPEAFPNAEWYSGDNVITAIGQGDVLATPLQLANLYSTFVNQGAVHVPKVVARVLDPNGETVEQFLPEVSHVVAMPAEIWQPMLQGFVGVTSASGGTANSVFGDWDHEAWPVGGKTGTAEVDNKADSGLFAGFGPATDPAYVISVVMEESGFGGTVAAPVARNILGPLSNPDLMPEAPTVDVSVLGQAAEPDG